MGNDPCYIQNSFSPKIGKNLHHIYFNLLMIDRIIEDMTITYTRTVFFSEFRDIKSVDFYD